MTYREFQSACSKAWKTEGQGDINIKAAHDCLLRAEKTTYQTFSILVSKAWVIYKRENRIN